MRLLEFELSNYFWFIIFIIHSLKHNDTYDTIKIFGVGLIYGGLCESYGIWAGYFFEPNYLIYVPGVPAPLSTMIGWTVIYYFSFFITDKLFKKLNISKNLIFLKSIITGIVATSFDFMIDPIAIKAGWWIWESKFGTFFLGVPLINFVAWFFAVSVWSFFFYYISNSYKNKKLQIIFLTILIPFYAFIAGSLTFGFMKFLGSFCFN